MLKALTWPGSFLYNKTSAPPNTQQKLILLHNNPDYCAISWGYTKLGLFNLDTLTKSHNAIVVSRLQVF
jgi:hypothetical protein